MTTCTLSLAISPPLFRWNVRHIGTTQRLAPFHRAVDDVDGVRAQHRINSCTWPSGPAFNLVLPHAADKLPLIRVRQLAEIPSKDPAAALVNRDDGGSVEIGERRTDVEDTGLKQSFVRRHRELLIDVVGDPGLTRMRHQCLAESLQGLGLMGIEKTEGHITRPRLSGRHDDFSSAYGKSQRTQGRALDEAASTNVRHGLLLPDLFLFCFRNASQKICGITGQL